MPLTYDRKYKYNKNPGLVSTSMCKNAPFRRGIGCRGAFCPENAKETDV